MVFIPSLGMWVGAVMAESSWVVLEEYLFSSTDVRTRWRHQPLSSDCMMSWLSWLWSLTAISGHIGFHILVILGLQGSHSDSLSPRLMCTPCVCVHFLACTITSGRQLLSRVVMGVYQCTDEIDRTPGESVQGSHPDRWDFVRSPPDGLLAC